ncbi:MAG: hypothetical protein JXA60_08330 [Candidatus Coatesbacteria bacterium]|nr:hypothetical protein [Candidatus Coatesbacteria bacterium]
MEIPQACLNLLEQFRISAEEADITTIMTLYPKEGDVVQITSNGKILKGWDQIKAGYESLFRSFSPKSLEFSDVKSWWLDDLLFTHFPVNGKVRNVISGESLDYASIGTLVLKKSYGESWHIVFEQFTLYL